MNDDIESKLDRLLNEQVDARVGHREPPPFRQDRSGGRPGGRRRFAPWVPPLLAAACIAAIVGGSVAGTQLLSAPAPKHSQVGTNQPSPVRPSSSALRTFTPVPTSTPASPIATPSGGRNSAPASPVTTTEVPGPGARTTGGAAKRSLVYSPPASADRSHSAAADGPTFVRLGAATIALPHGWAARDLTRYNAAGESSIEPGWCLTPKDEAVHPGDCPVILWTPGRTDAMDVGSPTGFIGNPPQCFSGAGSSERAGERSFGGQDADWRAFRTGCVVDGKRMYQQRYVVANIPGYVLYTERHGQDIDNALAAIAGGSHLPGPTTPLRRSDEGYLRSAHRTGATVHITLDRAIEELDGHVVNPTGTTYRYDVPASVWDSGNADRPLHVGGVIVLATNGRSVTQVYAA